MDDIRDRLESDLARLAAAHGVPGAAVAVSVGDEVAEAAAGVVNRRTGVPVTAESVFQIQSITKVWTATLVMQLVDEGLVRLDDPVREHLPGFRTADAAASARITLAHLLSHTGGFEGDLWATTTEGDDALRQLVEDAVPGLPQHEEPGSRYSYCSAGMAVLGRIVEVARGLPYAAALRRYLSGPLGVESIAFDPNGALGFNTAIGHVPRGERGMWPVPVWATMPASNPAAGNRLAMSVRGLLAFGRMHAADGVAPGGERVLSAAAARDMREARAEKPAGASRSVGLGWEVRAGGAVVGHGGGSIGFGSMLYVVPEQRTAVALVVNGGDDKGLIRDLVDPIVESAAGVPIAASSAAAVLPVGDPGRYTGVYANGAQRVTVSADGDGLEAVVESAGDALAMLELAGIPAEPAAVRLGRVEGDLFALNGGEGRVRFLDAADGPARFVHLGERSVPRVG